MRPLVLLMLAASVAVAEEARGPAWLTVNAGVGVGFRDLSAQSSLVAVPRLGSAAGTPLVTAAVFPFRLVPSLASSALANLGVEGLYRRSLVSASVDGAPCGVIDDEALGRVTYLAVLAERFPRVGVSGGVSFERAAFSCPLATLDTTYGSAEFLGRIVHTVLSDRLSFEAAAGPRFLWSVRVRDAAWFAFAAEAWVGWRQGVFLARVGGRLTSTQLTSWPHGVPLVDVRGLLGVTVGLSL